MTATATAARPVSQRKITKRALSLFALFLPAAVLLFLFNYLPIYGIIISFKDFTPYRGILGSAWAGLDHFRFFLSDARFWNVVKNTIYISLLDILIGFPAPIVFALLANELASKPFKRLSQTVSYLPHFVSWVVVYGIMYQLLSPLHGMLNKLVVLFGADAVHFMGRADLFRPLVVVLEIWKNMGWGAILYFAALTSIDSDLYEAAYIDGSSRLRMVFSVTLPGLLSVIMLLLIFRISRLFLVEFERIFVFANPLNYGVSDVLAVYIYRLGLEQAQYSLTAAIGLVQSLIAFCLLFAAHKIARKLTGIGLW
jgi:putative aldouronate transport system permease protein